uniref:U2A'/phosphoprotein 32 family A C-terminal domain-containing protein n=1 Tax=Strigamia maritima TaxID=126957 RepID=T1J5B4_STRMM
MGDQLEEKLSYLNEDCVGIPEKLANSYGGTTRRLDLSYNFISNLDGLEKFVHLEDLILDNNQLDDSITFTPNPFLHTLSLNKNKISDLDGLLSKISNSFPNLRYLSLMGNLACPHQLSGADKDDDDYQRYRYYVIYKLQKLKFLDFMPVKSREAREANRVGKYMRVIRPSSSQMVEHIELPFSLRSAYSPLPKATTSLGSHSGAYGKCRYHYSGKHSEGNRFIRNSDL